MAGYYKVPVACFVGILIVMIMVRTVLMMVEFVIVIVAMGLVLMMGMIARIISLNVGMRDVIAGVAMMDSATGLRCGRRIQQKSIARPCSAENTTQDPSRFNPRSQSSWLPDYLNPQRAQAERQ
jgi:hypothetical protein